MTKFIFFFFFCQEKNKYTNYSIDICFNVLKIIKHNKIYTKKYIYNQIKFTKYKLKTTLACNILYSFKCTTLIVQ